MTETMTLAPVVKSVHVAATSARLRGVHARNRLVVAARRDRPASGGGARGDLRGARGRRGLRDLERRRAVALGHGARVGAAVALTIAWKVDPEAAAPTEVEVRFTPDGDGTRVVLEHRHWERLGEGAAGAGRYDGGWVMVLASTSPVQGDHVEVRWRLRGHLGRRLVPPWRSHATRRARRVGRRPAAIRARSRRGRSLGRLLQLRRRPQRSFEDVLRVHLLPGVLGFGVNAGVWTRWYCSRWPSHAPPMNGTICSRVQMTSPISTAVEAGLLAQLPPNRVLGCLAGSIPPPGVAQNERPGTRSERAGFARPGRSRSPEQPAGSGARSRAVPPTISRKALNQRSRSSQGTAAFAGEVDGSTKSAVSPSRRSWRPCSAPLRNGPRYASLPTNAITPGRSSRATVSSRSALPSKSPARRSPEPGVVR